MTLALSSMGYLEWGKYVSNIPPLICPKQTPSKSTKNLTTPPSSALQWRYLSGASIILIEIHTLTRPNPPGIATILLNPLLSILPKHQPQLLPFQILLLARKIGLATSIAISQLGTHSDSSNSSISSGAGGYNDIDPIRLQHLETLTLAIDNTTTRLLHMDVAPFESSSSLVGNGDGNGDGRSSSPQLLTAGMVDWLCRNAERADPAVRGAIVRVLQSSARGSGSGDGDLEDDDDDDEKDKRVS